MYIAERHHKNEESVKEKIVDGYRRGVCDHNGKTLPPHKQGMAGKGCHFIGSGLIKSDSWPTKMVKLWPRDSNGELIDG